MAPGLERSSSVAVTVPSIMSPDTTTREMPFSARFGRSSRRASSPARLLRATGSYSGMVGTVLMKCAWWLVTKTTREPSFISGTAALSMLTWASRFSLSA